MEQEIALSPCLNNTYQDEILAKPLDICILRSKTEIILKTSLIGLEDPRLEECTLLAGPTGPVYVPSAPPLLSSEFILLVFYEQ